MPYLIDGHNLIPKLGLRLDSPDDEMQLIGILQQFARISSRNAQVYFDGAPAGQARTKRFGKVTAHFIRLESSADAAIKGQIHRLGPAARNWTVISSDHAIQIEARAAHAIVISSEEFAKQLMRLNRSRAQSNVEIQLTSEEISEWLKLFEGKK